jgi:hypothetical protein
MSRLRIWPVYRYYLDVCVGSNRNITKNHNQDSGNLIEIRKQNLVTATPTCTMRIGKRASGSEPVTDLSIQCK